MLRRNSSFWNPAIWLAERILAYISWTRFFLKDLCRNTANKNFKYRINTVKINNQIFWPISPIFRAKKVFPRNRVVKPGFLAPCQNSEKFNDLISRKHLDRCQTLGKDEQTLFHKILSAAAMGLITKTEVNRNLQVKDTEYNVGLTRNYCITKWPHPILTTSTQKSLKLLLDFLNLHQHAKNQFIPSTHSWDTATFRVLWPG